MAVIYDIGKIIGLNNDKIVSVGLFAFITSLLRVISGVSSYRIW